MTLNPFFAVFVQIYCFTDGCLLSLLIRVSYALRKRVDGVALIPLIGHN